MKEKIKNNNAITLLALIITVIVLLILATVSINLVINNGILDKAKTAVDKYSEGEITEQIKLAYQEYQMSRFSDSNSNLSNFLKTTLEKNYGDGNVEIINSSDTITLKINQNGNSRFFSYNVVTGESGEISKGINYGGKDITEIVPGDDITIVTEKFKVFSVDDGKIKAMPYYNITLTDMPLQSKESETISFSTRPYWSTDENGEEIENWSDKADEINMSNPANNIQKYIIKYKETLQNFGAKKIEVRALKRSEFGNSAPNPGLIGSFWVGSCNGNSTQLFLIYNRGNIGGGKYSGKSGVRPIIEIPIN